MSQPTIDISFITLNYNGLSDTLALIESLVTRIQSVTYEIIVVDNGSKNQHEVQSQLQHYAAVTLISSSTNSGFAGGNNLAVQVARGRFLFFINNDTYIQEDHFAEFIHSYKSSIGILCPKIRFAQPPYAIQYAGFTDLSPITLRNRAIGYGETDQGQYDTPAYTNFAHGAAMMVSREVLNKVGPMSEDYFLYYEEMDWSTRFRQAGYAIGYQPIQTVFHKESQSTGQASPLKTYYLTRNRLKYAYKFQTGFARMLSLSYLVLIVGTRDVFKHACAFRWDLVHSTLKAITDFITHLNT